MRIIRSDKIPKPKGHYSACIEHKGFLFLSGQLPIDPRTKEIHEGIEKQTELALLNVKNILDEAGSSINQILQIRLYIPDVNLWNQLNEVYARFFGNHKPAGSVIPTRDLHYGCLIEIEAMAFTDK